MYRLRGTLPTFVPDFLAAQRAAAAAADALAAAAAGAPHAGDDVAAANMRLLVRTSTEQLSVMIMGTFLGTQVSHAV